jgi:predicted nucleic acid-binding protein
VTSVVIDDHLLRDVLTGDRSPDLGGIASSVATTGLWLFRLSSAWAAPEVAGKLTVPVAALPTHQQELFRARLVALPDEIEVLPLRQLAWPMALLQHRHRNQGRPLSAAMAEALAAAHALSGAMAVSSHDVGPNLKSAAEHDLVTFHIL